jgi:hypothetical protein
MALIVLYGQSHWRAATSALHSGLEAGRTRVVPPAFDMGELTGLPDPVKRYFRAVLQQGQPMVAAVNAEHRGVFNMSSSAGRWRPFVSTQRVITRRPGFAWDGRISMIPGVRVYVHDAYVAGEGILRATLWGLVSLLEVRASPEVAHGDLMRFLAEAACYPTALLPSQGVHWEAADEASARATLKDGATTVTMLFRFDGAGLITTVSAEARGRQVNGSIVPTPWEGRWWDYQVRDGMLVPLAGEVAWLLPEGPKPYWRGRVTALRYELSE